MNILYSRIHIFNYKFFLHHNIIYQINNLINEYKVLYKMYKVFIIMNKACLIHDTHRGIL
jgi:hypothetical protein